MRTGKKAGSDSDPYCKCSLALAMARVAVRNKLAVVVVYEVREKCSWESLLQFAQNN